MSKEPGTKNVFVASVAAVVAATLASLCCIGPVVLIALGLGGVGFATAFEPYRPYLLGLTALLLGVAFYFVYRKAKQQCAPGEACEKPSSRRAQKVGLWVVTVLAAGLAAYPYIIGAGASASDTDAQLADFNGKTIELDVGGMVCEGCAGMVEGTLVAVPGVETAEVKYNERRAEILVGSGSCGADRERYRGLSALSRRDGLTLVLVLTHTDKRESASSPR